MRHSSCTRDHNEDVIYLNYQIFKLILDYLFKDTWVPFVESRGGGKVSH
jgi:hypothetical protein